jgi:hypothetical protein
MHSACQECLNPQLYVQIGFSKQDSPTTYDYSIIYENEIAGDWLSLTVNRRTTHANSFPSLVNQNSHKITFVFVLSPVMIFVFCSLIASGR